MSANGVIVLDRPSQIAAYRMAVIIKGIELEMKGLQMSRGRSCYGIAKAQYGLTGNKTKVLAELKARHEAAIVAIQAENSALQG